VIAAGGLAVAIMAAAPALGANRSAAAGSTVKILSATRPGMVVVATTIKAIIGLKVPAGHWWIPAKLWAGAPGPHPRRPPAHPAQARPSSSRPAAT